MSIRLLKGLNGQDQDAAFVKASYVISRMSDKVGVRIAGEDEANWMKMNRRMTWSRRSV